jgi:cupin fold WbuC family metalloprotein
MTSPLRLALNPPVEDFYLLTAPKIQEGVQASRESPRRRIMVPIQRSEAAVVQRLLNIMQPGSYVRPHQHPRPHAIETVQVLQGAIGLFIFAEGGAVREAVRLAAGSAPSLADLEPRIWHTFTALAEDTVVLEIKGGPYDRARDKIFASWAPAEDEPGAGDYLRSLVERLA